MSDLPTDPLANRPGSFSAEDLGAAQDAPEVELDLADPASDTAQGGQGGGACGEAEKKMARLRGIARGLSIAWRVTAVAALLTFFWPAYGELVFRMSGMRLPGAPASPQEPTNGLQSPPGAALPTAASPGHAQMPQKPHDAPAAQTLLTIIANPSDASLRVNGKDFGPSQAMITVPCQPQTGLDIELTRPGYLPWQQHTSCGANHRVAITANLQATPRARGAGKSRKRKRRGAKNTHRRKKRRMPQ